jgi:hypothetical protein
MGSLPMAYLLVLLVGAAAGMVSGIVGTGSSMMLMPVLVTLFGPQQAVPIMALGALMGNLGKVLAWRSAIDWRVCAAYCSTAVPGAALGVHTLLALPARAVDIVLGMFFIAMVPARRWLARRSIKFSRFAGGVCEQDNGLQGVRGAAGQRDRERPDRRGRADDRIFFRQIRRASDAARHVQAAGRWLDGFIRPLIAVGGRRVSGSW